MNIFIHKTLDSLIETKDLIKVESEGHDRYRLAPNSGIKKEKAKRVKKSTTLSTAVKKLAKKSGTQSKKATTPS